MTVLALQQLVFIARQHAIHAQRDVVIPILSVRLSVCLSVHLTIRLMPVLKNPKGTSSAGALNVLYFENSIRDRSTRLPTMEH